MFDFPFPPFKRPTTRTEKADVAQAHGVSPVYRMSYNESPLGPSPKVVAAIRETAVSIGDYPTMGDERLRQALADTWGQGLTPDHFYTACSGYEAIELAGRAFLQPGDEIIITPPAFGAYAKVATLQGATTVQVPLTPPDFVPDIAAILTAVSERTRMVLLCNPHNPTGTMMNAAQMAELVAALPPHVVLIMDEVYFHFVTSPDYPNSVDYILDNRPVISIHTFSKGYGLAGLRLGYAIAPPSIAAYVGGLHRGFHQSTLALAAGIAALGDQAHLQQNVQTVLDGRQWLEAQCTRLGLDFIPSQTNFMVVRVPQSPKEVADGLLPFGVMIRPLRDPGLEDAIRVSISTPEANAQFVAGLEQVLNA